MTRRTSLFAGSPTECPRVCNKVDSKKLRSFRHWSLACSKHPSSLFLATAVAKLGRPVRRNRWPGANLDLNW
ncbi:hypothetical protein IMZ48_14665 [Candidatus Bathyarchaeota archaeon]|nr:hypothetical protein [Candidatus Bathyarchaeota archaeon]